MSKHQWVNFFRCNSEGCFIREHFGRVFSSEGEARNAAERTEHPGWEYVGPARILDGEMPAPNPHIPTFREFCHKQNGGKFWWGNPNDPTSTTVSSVLESVADYIDRTCHLNIYSNPPKEHWE